MRRLLVLWSILFLFAAKMPAEKSFDFATTPGKLPKEVVPTEYAVRIVPDLEKLTFTGSETVSLNARAPVRELVLNAAEIEISAATLDDKSFPPDAIKLDKQNELLKLALSAELAPGPHKLTLNFSGKINQQGRGFYYMPYK